MWRSEWEGGVQFGQPFQPSTRSSHPCVPAIHAFQPSMHSSHPCVPAIYAFQPSMHRLCAPGSPPVLAAAEGTGLCLHCSFSMWVEGAGSTLQEEGSYSSWCDTLSCAFSSSCHMAEPWYRRMGTCNGSLPEMHARDMQSLAWSGIILLWSSLCTHDHAPGLMLVMVSWISVICHQTGRPHTPEGGFLLPSDCQQALPWTSSQLLHHPVGCNHTFSSEIWNPT